MVFVDLLLIFVGLEVLDDFDLVGVIIGFKELIVFFGGLEVVVKEVKK